MPRTPTPEGKRVGWSVKLSQPKSDAADRLRGTMLRANWLESLIDAAIAAHDRDIQASRHETAPGHALTCKCLICRPEGQRR